VKLSEKSMAASLQLNPTQSKTKKRNMPNIRRSSPSNLGTNVEVKVLRPSDAKFISAGKVLFFLHKGSILSWQGDLPEI